MPTVCWAPGCKSGYPSDRGPKKHFFQAPKDNERLMLWRRKIPREGTLMPHHCLCDLHFQEHFILKKYVHIINGERVEMDRGRWELTCDAIPTIFPNVPKYLSQKVQKPRQRKPRVLVAEDNHCFEANIDLCTMVQATVSVDESGDAPESAVLNTSSVNGGCTKCRDKFVIQREKYQLQRRVCRQCDKIKDLTAQVKQLRVENDKLKQNSFCYENLSPKMKLIVKQCNENRNVKSKTGHRYSADWLLDALLIRCKSPRAYKFLRNNEYLPLPSISTLNRSIKNMRPEFGFDKALAAGLTEKLGNFPIKERRGILMFDEIQISKNIDFRIDTAKVVGMVDFGDLTTTENMSQEGDHALVFLFQPHCGGWMQTIGSFCAAGTTPTYILSKLIVQAIILLENCGALVDGIVSDGASTNRAALSTFGFKGTKGTVCNRMVNPCDNNRHIYFFCDMPHLLKTVRNNLLRAREFKTPEGVVKLSHYKLLLQNDLNPKTGLRAVPKLTDKHVAPNNFQKMSVCIAAQLFSKSTADGLALYQSHVDGLRDAGPTITFTRRINDLFDLLNGRTPVDGIWRNGRRDKLQELQTMADWLDSWEDYIMTQPEAQQKQFLSRPTCHGLRVTLKSTLELSNVLLSNGFSYVLTGKFCQDPLEMFFGIIRQSSGADDHPSANQFLYVYRLLSISSLVKPGRRASVQTNPVQILLTVQSMKPAERIPFVPAIETLLDSLLIEQSHQTDTDSEHDYTQSVPEECITFYLGGYVAYKLGKFTSCQDCISSLSDSKCSAKSRLVELKTYGGLKLPSTSLTNLIKLLEQSFQNFSEKPSTNMYFDVLNDILTHDQLPVSGIGCAQHCCSLTSRCIHFYITTRLHFLKKSVNRNRASRQTKQKLSKISKLT